MYLVTVLASPAINQKNQCTIMDEPLLAHTEIEARIGRQTPQGFDACCTFELLDKLLVKVNAAYPGQVSPWTEFVDYHYTLSDKRCVRTRAITDEAVCVVKATTVQKHRVASELFCVSPHNSLLSHVRLARSEEVPVANADLPQVVSTNEIQRVCIKQRASLTDGDYRYDFTLSWPASTREEAEAKQRDPSAIPQCFVEIEYTGKTWPLGKHKLRAKVCKIIAAMINVPNITLS